MYFVLNRRIALCLVTLASLLLLATTSTGCIVVSDGDHHPPRCHGDEWGDDWGHDDDDDDDDHDFNDDERCEVGAVNNQAGDYPTNPDPGSQNNAPETNNDPDNSDPGDTPDNNDPGDTPDNNDPGTDDPSDCPHAPDGNRPVCGEDGTTYPTPCAASRADVKIAYEGACGPSCFFDSDCSLYEVCAESGSCEPLDCSDAASEPVCGADQQSYGSSCEARANHVKVLYAGSCVSTCQADADCGAGEVCNGGSCELTDCPDDYAPVCATDGTTYDNRCLARVGRASIEYDGCCI